MTVKQILHRLKSLGNLNNVAGMSRFGIVAKKVYGASAPSIRLLAKEIGKNHKLALKLWDTEVYDARILSAFIDEPEIVSKKQMDSWVKDFDNWAICDGVCIHLFRKTPFAWKKSIEWSRRKEEFVKRAGFTLFATLAVHNKDVDNEKFIEILPIIKQASTDERNGVKKAVNWALRQIGKRNLILNQEAIKTAEEIKKIDSPSARWIASDALRELRSKMVQKRLQKYVNKK